MWDENIKKNYFLSNHFNLIIIKQNYKSLKDLLEVIRIFFFKTALIFLAQIKMLKVFNKKLIL